MTFTNTEENASKDRNALANIYHGGECGRRFHEGKKIRPPTAKTICNFHVNSHQIKVHEKRDEIFADLLLTYC